ncbi:MAG TPA: translation initiation factor IF-2, partial [Rhodospirillaceae bacterium]|nr:translation initiation factor IF-2 [Rhodospirillaceae bacterium]
MADEAAQRAAAAERKFAELEEESSDEVAPTKGRPARADGSSQKPNARPRNNERKRRSGKLTISEALDEEGGARQRSVAAFRRRQERERQRATADNKGGGQASKVVREVSIPDAITVGELGNRMAERGSEVIKALMKMGVMATINQTIDQETAQLVVEEFGHQAKLTSASDVELNLGATVEDQSGAQLPRPPVVTVMGHVDHG